MKMKKIPRFKTEEAEAKFWDEHSFTDFADGLEKTRAIFPKPRKKRLKHRVAV